MKREEDVLTESIVSFFKGHVVENKLDSLIFHIPNGGKRNKITASIMSRMGVLKGAPDLVVVHDFQVIFFEVKTETGKQSVFQKFFENICLVNMQQYYVIRSLEQFKKKIQ